MRVLVVEDDDILREQLTERMQASGYVVDAAADGKQGLYFALEYPIDIAIVDLGLPEINGMDIIKQLRDKGKDYPVIILTARTRWQNRVEGLEAGADDYVDKRVFVDDKEISLTAFEYKVIEHLMMRAGEVISKTDLTESMYDDDSDRDSNVIEVFIRRLRMKLDPDGTMIPIETLRGRGYRFTLSRNTTS